MKAVTYVVLNPPSFSPSSPPVGFSVFVFGNDAIYTPKFLSSGFPVIPSIRSVTFSPGEINPGKDLGTRTTVTVTFNDHRHVFAGESFNSGTFWGKWRGRYGLTLRGQPVLISIGNADDLDGSDLESRTYIIDRADGPSPVDGTYKMIFQDMIKLADGDRSQAPVPSNGFLVADITNSATAATLSPAGIGNSEYPASGYVAIGGNEICSFTRVGDALTLVRGQFNTTAVAHSVQDRVQLCLYYNGEDVSDIIYDLFTTYADVDPSYIDLSAWQTETTSFLGTLYTAMIGEPTSVNKLISELIEQAALAVWWDDTAAKIRLQVLRQISSSVDVYDEDNVIADSLTSTEQPDKRISHVYTYFGKINPLLPEDQLQNYRSTAYTADETSATRYGSAAIKKITSRWIPNGGRSIADVLNNKLLGRFVNPPRKFSFKVMAQSSLTPILGSGYQLESWAFQNENGSPLTVPIQITRLNPGMDIVIVEAQESLWTPFGTDIDPTNRFIIFDGNENDINLRTRHDQLYPAPQSGDTVTAYVNAGVIIGASSTSIPAMTIGTWPGGVTINLVIIGRIEGHGGDGGRKSGGSGTPGGNGGTALYTRTAINLTTTGGQLWSGGGGGGGDADGNGGGGAGQLPGAGGSGSGTPGSPGTTELGGAGAGSGGAGGGPGTAGTASTDAAGGDAGAAIDGVSFVTTVGAIGDIQGGQIN